MTLRRFGEKDGGEGGEDNDVLTMSLAVDVEDASDDQQWLYAYAFHTAKKNLETLVNKNIDYGSVFIESAVDAYVNGESEFDDVVTEILYRLKVRADDKDGRFGTQCFGDGNNYVEEDVDETASDNVNYWLLMQVIADYGEELVVKWVDNNTEYEISDRYGDEVDILCDGDVIASNIFDD